MDMITLAAARKYVNDTANALGAVKGSPCTIKSITETDDGATVVFSWTGADGVEQTSSTFLPRGPQGLPGEKGEPGAPGKDGSGTVDTVAREQITALTEEIGDIESNMPIKSITPVLRNYMIYNNVYTPGSASTHEGTYIRVVAGRTYTIARSVSGIIARGFSATKPSDTGHTPVTNYVRENDAKSMEYKASETGYLCLFFGNAGATYTFTESMSVRDYVDNKVADETEKLNPINFSLGSLSNAVEGMEIESTTRARSGFYPGKVGDVVRLYGGYEMLIFYYTGDYAYIGYSYTDETGWETEITLDHAGYFRILIRKDELNSEINEEDLASFSDCVFVSSFVSTYVNDAKNDLNAYIKIRTLDGFADYESEIGEAAAMAQSFAVRGKIVKSGTQILAADGEPIVLTGIGTHSISEYNNLYTPDVMRTLLYNGLNCIRVSVYLTDNTFAWSDGRTSLGWLNHSEKLKPIIEKLVNVATAEGLYVILDWHSYHSVDGGDVTQYQAQQEAFFRYFSGLYANHTNVIYELHNEPYQNTAAELLPSVRSCAQIIRANNADAILICGVGVDYCTAMDKLFNKDNNLDIFISPHLYTGDQEISDVTDTIEAGLPIFVSEWGNSALNGAGVLNNERANAFFEYLHDHGVSYCLWKMTYQNMSTSVLRHDDYMAKKSYPYGGWQKSDLSPNGKLYFNNIQDYRFGKHMH